jgi:ATP-dependent DNA helicase RecG
MNKAKILSIIKRDEGLQAEFKESKDSLSKDIFVTVCAFLNRLGGEILLGVNDKGGIIGINNDVIEQVKKDSVANINNPP